MSKHRQHRTGGAAGRGGSPASGRAPAHAPPRPSGRRRGAPMSRRAWLRAAGAGGVVLVLAAGAGSLVDSSSGTAPLGEIAVYKSATCGCCEQWVTHMRRAGFRVTEHDVADVTPIKQKYGVPSALHSCHTGLVGGYVVEGHVPADLVQRLLVEQPAVVGLAVPGMPVGSPGMEGAGKERYEVLAFSRAGDVTTYAVR